MAAGPWQPVPSQRAGPKAGPFALASCDYGADGLKVPPPFPKLHWLRSLLKKLLLDALTPSAW